MREVGAPTVKRDVKRPSRSVVEEDAFIGPDEFAFETERLPPGFSQEGETGLITKTGGESELHRFELRGGTDPQLDKGVVHVASRCVEVIGIRVQVRLMTRDARA